MSGLVARVLSPYVNRRKGGGTAGNRSLCLNRDFIQPKKRAFGEQRVAQPHLPVQVTKAKSKLLSLRRGRTDKDGEGSSSAIIRSYYAVSILPGIAFSRLDRFTFRWKCPDEPLVIGLPTTPPASSPSSCLGFIAAVIPF
jgi:hypothetical protein